MSERFGRLARAISQLTGSPPIFLVAILIVVVWALAGPIVGFSNTWQLAINTGTTVVTFLMVFLIQNTQNRDSQAVQLKLDELIRALSGARDEMIDLEDGSEERLARERERFRELASELSEASEDAGEAARAVRGAIETETRGETSRR